MQLVSQDSEGCVSTYSECAVLDTEPGLTYARQVLSHRVHLPYHRRTLPALVLSNFYTWF